jgi:uncharacterized protein YdbL (DUF1318 family)
MRSRLVLRLRPAAFLLAALLLCPLASAASASLDELKTQGLVGEQLDGYVGVVDPNAPPEVQTLVAEVNRKRAHEYESIAKRNGTTATAVAALAGVKLVGRAPPGQFVMDASGKWKKK